MERTGNPGGQSPKTYYVLHSGMNDPENEAALNIRKTLVERGIKPESIIVLDNVYPQDNWSRSEGRRIYNESLNVNSNDPKHVLNRQTAQFSRKARERGIRREDNVVGIGHSAGGVMLDGMAFKLENDPNAPADIDTVLSLGSPIRTKHSPERVCNVYCHSNGDVALSLAAHSMGTTRTPVNGEGRSLLDQNDREVVFTGPEKKLDDGTTVPTGPSHSDMHSDPRVLRTVLNQMDGKAEFVPEPIFLEPKPMQAARPVDVSDRDQPPSNGNAGEEKPSFLGGLMRASFRQGDEKKKTPDTVGG